jgi:hypothetical protein
MKNTKQINHTQKLCSEIAPSPSPLPPIVIFSDIDEDFLQSDKCDLDDTFFELVKSLCDD